MSALTKQDVRILQTLIYIGGAESPGIIAAKAGLRTSSPRETAARHCIKLTKLGYAFKSGSPMFPKWEATFDGRALIAQQSGDGK
jgi:hypothetical protein